MTDQELLVQLRAGSRGAFDAIFRAYYAPLVGLADSILRERAAAEDVVQDVMVELWRRRDTIHIENTLRSYLFRATRNRALNSIRHEQVAKRAAPLLASERATQPVAEHQLQEAELSAAVAKAVSELPARCREVFELSRVHGLRYAEIAAAMNISVKTVEAQMGKALRIVREKLAAWLPRSEEL